MLFALLASLAFATERDLVVRIDDRLQRDMEEPRVALVYWDGRRAEAVGRDDGVDAADKFAGDKLWIARVRAPGEGRAWVLLTDGAAEKQTRPMVRGVVLGEQAREQMLNFAVAELSDPPAEEGALPAMPEDFPLAPGAELEDEEPRVDAWSSALLTAAVSLALLAMVALVLARTALGELGQRLRQAATPLPAADARRTRWLSNLLTAGVLVGLLAAVWGPALPWIRSDFLGIEYVDHYGTQWFYWFVDYNQREGLSSGSTQMFFYPWGKDIYAHTGANVLDAWAALPFRRGLGPVFGYNLFVLLNMALSGLAFYVVAREVTDDRWAAALGAALYTIHPFLLIELEEGRPTQGLTLLPVLFFWCVLRAGRVRGFVMPVVGGVLLALTGFQYWFYALFGGFSAAIYGLWRSANPLEGAGGGWRTLGRYVLMGVVAFLVVAPEALPMVIATTKGEDVPGLLDTTLWSAYASPPITREGFRIGLFSWQPLHQALGFLVIDDSDKERFLAQTIAFPWVVGVLMLLWYHRPGRLERGVVIALGVSLTLIAMGPVLLVGSHALPNLPYIALVKAVGFLQRLWWPSRSLLFLVMLVSLCTTVAVAWLRTLPLRTQAAGLLGMAGWWAWDLHDLGVLPFPTWDATVPAGYRCLASSKEGALIELPYAWTQAHLYYQTVHERPLLGGMLEDNPTFTPEEFTKFRTTNPMVSRLLKGDPVGSPYDWDPMASKEVQELGYRYVVVQKDAFYMPEDTEGEMRLAVLMFSLEQVFRAPVYNDGRIAIYAPFGDPPPCDIAELVPDPAPFGPTEERQGIREPDREKQLFTRWIVDE